MGYHLIDIYTWIICSINIITSIALYHDIGCQDIQEVTPEEEERILQEAGRRHGLQRCFTRRVKRNSDNEEVRSSQCSIVT